MATAGSEAEKNALIQSIDKDLETHKRNTLGLHEKRRQIGERLDNDLKPQILAANQKIKAMENTSDRKLEVRGFLISSNFFFFVKSFFHFFLSKILRLKNNAAFRGVLWLRNNKHLFQGNVYEPMIMEVSYAYDIFPAFNFNTQREFIDLNTFTPALTIFELRELRTLSFDKPYPKGDFEENHVFFFWLKILGKNQTNVLELVSPIPLPKNLKKGSSHKVVLGKFGFIPDLQCNSI